MSMFAAMTSSAWADRLSGRSVSTARAMARRTSGGRLVEVSTIRSRRLCARCSMNRILPSGNIPGSAGRVTASTVVGIDYSAPMTFRPRVGIVLAEFCERYFPDAFAFALAAVLIVFAAGLALGEKPLRLVTELGNGFWVLVPFTMQMALIIIGGFVVASSPPVAALIRRLASLPGSPRGAVAFVAFFAMVTSLLSWGLSLIFTGLLVREV